MLYFNADGTYQEKYARKNCPGYVIEDVKGFWYHKENPTIRQGIILLSTENSKIAHDWHHYHIVSLTESVMVAVVNASFGNFWEQVWILKLNGTKLPENYLAENPNMTMAARVPEIDVTPYFNPAEIDAANTAKSAAYLTQTEKLIYLHSNLARMYPGKYKKLVEGYVNKIPDYLKKDVLADKKYYGSLLTDLASRKSAQPLQPNKELYDFAFCWAKESGDLGLTGHDRKTCKDFGDGGENCSYGYYTAHEMVISLLIDYDVEGFGHRYNLLNPSYSTMGAAIHPHTNSGICLVQGFTIIRFWHVLSFGCSACSKVSPLLNDNAHLFIRQHEFFCLGTKGYYFQVGMKKLGINGLLDFNFS